MSCGSWQKMDDPYRCRKCGFAKDTPNHELGCEDGNGRKGLARAAQDAGGPGASDRLYRPGDFDGLRQGAGDPSDEGRRDPRVVVSLLSRQELEALALRLMGNAGG